MFKSWIFDMDGVLINSEPLHYEVDRLILEEEGFPVESSFLDRFVGTTNGAMWSALKGELNLGSSVEDLIDRQIRVKLDLLERRDYRPIEGVRELMEGLRERGITLGVASSSPPVFIRAVLEKLDLAAHVTAWESAERVERSKPAPHVYLRVAELLGRLPGECAAVEDSASGVQAAKAAGLYCYGYQNPHSGRQDLSGADCLVKSIKDIEC
ncbi:MAG: HAD family phosphatase [Spirochaetales bacterium]|nr:HAD family phosphatase [Spirochaetales bacterium]